MDVEDEKYVCQLDEYSLKKAALELHEDPTQRLSSVRTLRAWIRSQKHFTCRVDTEFLLRVLRAAKFSQLAARERIELILTWMTKYPECTVNLDTHDPTLVKMVERGMYVPFPKADQEGRQIILFRSHAIDAQLAPSYDTRLWLSVAELLQQTSETRNVNGCLCICDMTEFGPKLFARSATDSAKKSSRINVDNSMFRVKAIHIYNAGALFEMLMGLAKSTLKKKLVDRIHVNETMESLYKAVPMEHWPDEYLPDDYKGPSAGPIQGLIDDLKRRLMEPTFRARLLDYTSDRYKIDESKKVKGVPEASFRKLTMD